MMHNKMIDFSKVRDYAVITYYRNLFVLHICSKAIKAPHKDAFGGNFFIVNQDLLKKLKSTYILTVHARNV